MATKMRCPRCDGRKYIEKEAGLIQEECPECAVPNANYQNGNEVFERANTGSDKGTSGSDKGKTTGNRQPKGKKTVKKVRKGIKPVLPATRKKPTVPRPSRVP